MQKMNKAQREGRKLFEAHMNHANLRELCERFILLHGNGNDDADIWAHTINLANVEIAKANQLGFEGSYTQGQHA